MEKRVFEVFVSNFVSEEFDGIIKADSLDRAVRIADNITRLYRDLDSEDEDNKAVMLTLNDQENGIVFWYTNSKPIVAVYPEEDYEDFKKDYRKLIDSYVATTVKKTLEEIKVVEE